MWWIENFRDGPLPCRLSNKIIIKKLKLNILKRSFYVFKSFWRGRGLPRHLLGAPLSVAPRSPNQYRQVRSTVSSATKTAVSATDGTLKGALSLSEFRPLRVRLFRISQPSEEANIERALAFDLNLQKNSDCKNPHKTFGLNTFRRVYTAKELLPLESVDGLEIFKRTWTHLDDRRKHDYRVTFARSRSLETR